METHVVAIPGRPNVQKQSGLPNTNARTATFTSIVTTITTHNHPRKHTHRTARRHEHTIWRSALMYYRPATK